MAVAVAVAVATDQAFCQPGLPGWPLPSPLLPYFVYPDMHRVATQPCLKHQLPQIGQNPHQPGEKGAGIGTVDDAMVV